MPPIWTTAGRLKRESFPAAIFFRVPAKNHFAGTVCAYPENPGSLSFFSGGILLLGKL
jgi:hypothetical protein